MCGPSAFECHSSSTFPSAPNWMCTRSTYFLQADDTTALFLYQELAPNSFIRRKGAKKYFRRPLPVLCTVATKDNRYGVVHLR